MSAAVESRLVFKPGSVAFRSMVSNACSRDEIFVLPSKPEMVITESDHNLAVVQNEILNQLRTLLANEVV